MLPWQGVNVYELKLVFFLFPNSTGAMNTILPPSLWTAVRKRKYFSVALDPSSGVLSRITVQYERKTGLRG